MKDRCRLSSRCCGDRQSRSIIGGRKEGRKELKSISIEIVKLIWFSEHLRSDEFRRGAEKDGIGRGYGKR